MRDEFFSLFKEFVFFVWGTTDIGRAYFFFINRKELGVFSEQGFLFHHFFGLWLFGGRLYGGGVVQEDVIAPVAVNAGDGTK